MIPDAVFTLDKAKAHLRVTHALEDALITALLDAAVAACERITRRAWTQREWTTLVDACDLCGCDAGSPAPFHALLSPATAKVWATDSTGSGGVEIPAVDISVSNRYGHSVIAVHDWTANGTVGIVGRIDWSAAPQGDEVPPDVYAAAMLFLGDLYANRESQFLGTIVAQNAMAETLLRPYVVEMHA